MMKNKQYKNGQKTYELQDDYLTYYFEDGTKKAEGPYKGDKMQGQWIFYRKTGQLWQKGAFKDDQKHGRFVRYDKNDKLEYDETFENGKLMK